MLEVPVRTGFNWTGFHVGAAVGAGAFLLDEGLLPLSGDGIFGEISTGYDYMFSDRLLVGAFADARYGGQEGSLNSMGSELSLTQSLGFDIGLRAGYLVAPHTLAYVLGGYAWQRIEADASGSGVIGGLDHVDGDGFTVGAGLETAIGGNWTLKNEYRYASYRFEDGFETEDVSTHTYRVGVNYRFGAKGGTEAAFEAPVYNWTGFYVGGQAGVAAGIDKSTLAGGLTFDGVSDDGGWASLNVGYDHEFGGAWVAGIQAGVRYMSLGTAIVLADIPIDRDYGFDLLARVGAKFNETTLAYVIGGYTNQHFELDAGPGTETDWNSGGYTIGAGIEIAAASNVTVNFEYRFSQFDDHDPIADLGSPGQIVTEPRFHTFSLGAKYKFN